MLVAALKNYKSTGNVFRNNLTFNGVPGEPSVRVVFGDWPPPVVVSAKDGDLLGVDPQFTNPGLHDFSLQPSSPAQGRGITAKNLGPDAERGAASK